MPNSKTFNDFNFKEVKENVLVKIKLKYLNVMTLNVPMVQQ